MVKERMVASAIKIQTLQPVASRNRAKKKKDKFGFAAKEHEEILKNLKVLVNLSNPTLFEDKLFALKNKIISYINKDVIPAEHTSLLLEIFSRACLSTDEKVLSILSHVPTSCLIQKQLTFHLLKWTTTEDIMFCTKVALSCLEIFECCLRMYQHSLRSVCFDGLMNFINYLKDKHMVARMQRFRHSQFKVISRCNNTNLTTNILPSRRTDKYTSFMPYDDFRRLPTIPTADDILTNEKIALRPVIAQGGYPNGEEYLDIQYRLIREDLISPLRDGIQEIRTKATDPKIKLAVYSGVQVLYPICTFRGVIYRICFDNSNMKGIPWEQTKKLIFGSLLCFTCDNFKTMIFGTVANREVYSLRHGVFDVRFASSKEVHRYTTKKVLTMVECPSFFEAYRHVMDCLKEINPFILPMTRYIVDCQTDLRAPKYLRDQPTIKYDMRGAFDASDERLKRIPIFQVRGRWEYETDLNQSQVDALQHALLNEFVLIQGPPGTGKTFCGLRIAHCLLSNIHAWNPSGDTPMLIVCYTNHALDQFLQGLIKFGHKKIIRVGGRFSEEMEKYSMQTAKQKFRQKCRLLDKHQLLRYQRSVTSEARDQFAKDLGPYMKSVKKFQEAIRRGRLVNFGDVRHCLDDHHAEYFADQDRHCEGLKISIFDIFLDLCKIPLAILRNVSRLDTQVKSCEVYEVKNYSCEDEEITEEDLIDVVGEGNALVERWVIDENEFRPIATDDTNLFDFDDDFDDATFVDEHGFKLVTMSKHEKERKVRKFINSVEAMDEDEVEQVVNPWELSITDRWRLYKYWLSIFMQSYDDYVELSIQQYEDACEEATVVREKEQEIILKSTNIIAMTTTCAGRYRHILQSIKPKVVIIEEAAEVLEAHVIASVIKETEHCILIGDHKQLRPSPTVHELASNYHLELSLFERMVNNGIKCPRLNVQHRMRPDISRLLRHIYPDLTDHESVMKYDDVLGVEKNLFFINHTEKEKRAGRMTSKANTHEAKFLSSLCLYFLNQDYFPEQITILTGYSAQLQELRRFMPRSLFEGVKVTSVDNFQGEENDIILLSLVRSNDWKSIGFLKSENRICVSLSRARKGLYVIGNFELLKEQSELWRNIIADAKELGCYGDELSLVCQNHPCRKVGAKLTEDFDEAPEGGCTEICGFQLPCSHICESWCHPYDPEHNEYDCQELCLKSTCGEETHNCQQTCHFGIDCEPCQIVVEKLISDCGHTQFVPCSVEPERVLCQFPCEKLMECGHACSKSCGDECSKSDECEAMVDKSLSCGHTQNIKCSVKIDDAQCQIKCEAILECAHICSGTCHDCQRGNFHVRCTEICNQIFNCTHECQGVCGHSCTFCQVPCRSTCEHSDGEKKCGEVCEPCKQPCNNSCEHRSCSRLCYEECDVDGCEEQCTRKLECGHTCVGLCGEKCPKLCRICDKDMFIGKTNSPVISLECCGNMVSVEQLDQIMSAKWSKISPQLVQLEQCPSCDEVISNIYRYKSQVTKLKEDLRKIEVFKKAKEAEKVEKMMLKAYMVCHSMSSFRLSNSKTLKTQDRLDYQMICSRADLHEFKKYLDLRYLARNETKSNLLLLAERMVQCNHVLDAYRLTNQISLLQYVHQFLDQLQSAGPLDGRRPFLERDVNDLVNRSMDSSLSIHQARDLFLQLQRLFLRFQSILCQQQIRKGLKVLSTHLEKMKAADTHLKSNIKKLKSDAYLEQDILEEIRETVASYNKQFGLKVVEVAKQATVGSTKSTFDRIWYKCRRQHLFAALDYDDVLCPKCDDNGSSEEWNRFEDEVSLEASNDFFSPCRSSYQVSESDNEGGGEVPTDINSNVCKRINDGSIEYNNVEMVLKTQPAM